MPQQSVSRQHQEYLQPRLGDTSRLQRFIFEAAEPGGNAFSAGAIRDMFAVHAELAAIVDTSQNPPARLSSLCSKRIDGVLLICPTTW